MQRKNASSPGGLFPSALQRTKTLGDTGTRRFSSPTRKVDAARWRGELLEIAGARDETNWRARQRKSFRTGMAFNERISYARRCDRGLQI